LISWIFKVVVIFKRSYLIFLGYLKISILNSYKQYNLGFPRDYKLCLVTDKAVLTKSLSVVIFKTILESKPIFSFSLSFKARALKEIFLEAKEKEILFEKYLTI